MIVIVNESTIEVAVVVGPEAGRTIDHPQSTLEARRDLMRIQSGLIEVPLPESGVVSSSSRPSTEGKSCTSLLVFHLFWALTTLTRFLFSLVEVLEELSRMEDYLQALGAEHTSLCVAIGLIRDPLGIPRSEDSFALISWMVLIAGRICELEVDAFWLRVHHTLVVTRSHYEGLIKLDRVWLGYANRRRDDELKDLGASVEPFAQRLADSHVDFVFPKMK